MNLIKLRCNYKLKEIGYGKDMLCSFGGDALNVHSDCNITYHGSSYLGDYYESPSANEHFALAGCNWFKVLEMEVYKVL
jgi:hypothetical protein